MRILIATNSLHQIAGGAERQVIMLANELSARGHHMHLLSRDTQEAQAFYPIHADISWHRQDFGDPKKPASLSAKWRRAMDTRSLVASVKPELVICFQMGTFTALKLYCLGQRSLGHLGPMIAAERISPYAYDYLSSKKRQKLLWRIMATADAITVQCPSYVKAFPAALQRKIHVIPNVVTPVQLKDARPPSTSETNRLLCVGRLCFQKNQSVLLKAFSKLAPSLRDWRLDFAGDGEDRAALQQQAQKLGISNQIRFLGAVKDVASLYQSSQLFCLPSRWEGFPNALSEALSHGLPSVGFADCGGVSDLIDHQSNGLLAKGTDDAVSLTDSLAELMRDPAKRAAMSSAAQRSMQAYAPPAIYDSWEQLAIRLNSRPNSRSQ